MSPVAVSSSAKSSSTDARSPTLAKPSSASSLSPNWLASLRARRLQQRQDQLDMIREKRGEDEDMEVSEENRESDKDLNTREEDAREPVEDYKEADFEQFADVTIEPPS